MKTSTAYLLSDTARLLRRAFDARVRRLGMTSTQARLLLILDVTEGENQGYYAERIEVEPITLCRLIDRLVDSDLIERRADPADRRAWRVHLTGTGRELIDTVRDSLIGLEDEMLMGLNEDRRHELVTTLEAIRANFSAPRASGVAANG